jgi:hypothetical protein
MFQAKTTRIALALVLILALTSASSAVALARDQPLSSGVVAERAPVAWVSLFLSLLTKAGGRMDGNGQKAGGRMDGNGLKAGGRMDGNGLSLRVAACIDDESDPQCEDGGR